jgi:hypothetical protein
MEHARRADPSGQSCRLRAALAHTAAWAQAIKHAVSGDGEQAVSQSTRAARRLEHHGKAYTALRLLTDLLPFVDGDRRARLAEHAAHASTRWGR